MIFNNNNTAANQFKINYDSTNPDVIITADKDIATNSPFTATFTFSEDLLKFCK